MKLLGNVQTKELIAHMLRKEILSGRIPDGEELTQEELAEKLQVSRMPVREALQTLEMDGLLVRMQNRHMRVAGLREETVSENMRVIASIESEIGLILAQSGKDLSPFDSLMGKYVDSNSDRRRNLEISFHLLISELTNNPFLSRAHHSLFRTYPQFILENMKLDFSNQLEHLKNISHAIHIGDPQLIRQAIWDSYQSLCFILLQYIKGISRHE